MLGLIIDNNARFSKRYIIPEINDYYTCSFTEFVPFCFKLYYFSNFKDFNTLAQA